MLTGIGFIIPVYINDYVNDSNSISSYFYNNSRYKRKLMNLKHTFTVGLLFLSSMGVVYAGGEPVNEDLVLLVTLSDNLIQLGKQGDSDGFVELANMALKLTAENRNNSLILPRASAKFREAKLAVKAGKFNEGVEAVEKAQTILMKKKVLRWDGGS